MIDNNFEIKISQLGDKFPQIGGKFNQSEFNNHIPSELGKIKLENPLNIDVETLAKERFGHGLYVKSADQKSEYILDERGTTILLFEGEENGKFESIYSPLSKEQLRREILVLPVEQQKDLSKMLKLPEPTQKDLEEFKMIQTGRESDKNLLNAALKLPEGIHSGLSSTQFIRQFVSTL